MSLFPFICSNFFKLTVVWVLIIYVRNVILFECVYYIIILSIWTRHIIAELPKCRNRIEIGTLINYCYCIFTKISEILKINLVQSGTLYQKTGLKYFATCSSTTESSAKKFMTSSEGYYVSQFRRLILD